MLEVLRLVSCGFGVDLIVRGETDVATAIVMWLCVVIDVALLLVLLHCRGKKKKNA